MLDAGATTPLCLKPPRELAALLDEQPDVAQRVFATVNIRQLAPGSAAALLNADVSPFTRVELYESHGGTAEGVKNINPRNVPRAA